MTNPIEENAVKIIMSLYENDPDQNLSFEGKDLVKFLGLSPNELNDAIDYLEDRGLIDRNNFLGTAPYKFGYVTLNSRGRYLYHEIISEKTILEEDNSEKSSTHSESTIKVISKQPLAAGSPFGFTDFDWEFVQEESSKQNIIKVVFGYQFKSEFYDSKILSQNVELNFQKAIKKYNEKGGKISVKLNYIPLAAGYGEHLFNQIARDIISSDIAVFETSDLNPNVMIEMGVALTWGKRVVPIKQKDRLSPPSDISGQTYLNYLDSGAIFESEDHDLKMIAMIERAIQKKQ
jgi:DNA-binding MarR family transcriptional regulator